MSISIKKLSDFRGDCCKNLNNHSYGKVTDQVSLTFRHSRRNCGVLFFALEEDGTSILSSFDINVIRNATQYNDEVRRWCDGQN